MVLPVARSLRAALLFTVIVISLEKFHSVRIYHRNNMFTNIQTLHYLICDGDDKYSVNNFNVLSNFTKKCIFCNYIFIKGVERIRKNFIHKLKCIYTTIKYSTIIKLISCIYVNIKIENDDITIRVERFFNFF